MKLKTPALILFFFISRFFITAVSAQDSIYKKDDFFIGGYAGITSFSTLGKTKEAVEISAGADQLILTARFYRSKSSDKYFFEDAIEIGWRKKLNASFTNTLSIGYADLAFEHDFYTHPEISAKNFDKKSGLILEEKFAYRFRKQNDVLSVWGIAANYYCIFYDSKPIHGWSLGIDMTLDYTYWNNPNRVERIEERNNEKSKRSKNKKVNKELASESTVYTNRIRTNFITGMAFSPHLDFEHRYSKKWGWGIGIFAWPYHGSRPILRMFDNPDFQMSGGGGFADWIYFQPSWKNDHYWTFGLRAGYRNLSGVCAIGTKIMSPDYYVKRSRQDIVTAWRVSFVMPPHESNWSLDWYFTFGARTSFYKTKFPESPSPNFEPYFPHPKNGCYVLPEFTGGFEFGFGW